MKRPPTEAASESPMSDESDEIGRQLRRFKGYDDKIPNEIPPDIRTKVEWRLLRRADPRPDWFDKLWIPYFLAVGLGPFLIGAIVLLTR